MTDPTDPKADEEAASEIDDTIHLNEVSDLQYEAIEQALSIAVSTSPHERPLARLLQVLEAISRSESSKWTPILLLVVLGWEEPPGWKPTDEDFEKEWDTRTLERFHRLRAIYGAWIRPMMAAESEGERDWRRFAVRPISFHPATGEPQHRVSLNIQRNDLSEFEFETPPDSLITFMRRIIARLTEFPVEVISAIELTTLNDLVEQAEKLKQIIEPPTDLTNDQASPTPPHPSASD